MYDRVYHLGASTRVAEADFTAIAAAVNLPTVDGEDWVGALQGDFSSNRFFGYPLIDVAVFVDSGDPVNINLQYRRPTLPVNNAVPVFTSTTTFLTVGVGSGSWGQMCQRVAARFFRIQIEPVGIATSTGYVVVWVRNQ